MDAQKDRNHGEGEVKPVKTLHFDRVKHPGEIDAANELARLLNRRPHDAVGTFLKQIEPKMPEVLKYCRENLQLAI